MAIHEGRSIVFDIDGTICPIKLQNEKYEDLEPRWDFVRKMREYKDEGFYIILFTSRQMRTHNGNIGRINATTLKAIFRWLDNNNIPYDEVHVGKPWPGHGGFYVDDKAIRPSEFMNKTYEEIIELTKEDYSKKEEVEND